MRHFPSPNLYIDLGEARNECRVMVANGEPDVDADMEYGSVVLAMLGLDDPCEPGESGSGEAAVPSAAVVARMLWDELDELPDPVIHIAPGRAITGLPAYLEIAGPSTRQFVDPPGRALGWTMVTDVRSTYEIDWGDGTPVVTTTSQGGPYPDGDVWHDYRYIDKANVVTVTQRWTATWEATRGGIVERGTIDAPLRTVTTLPLPIWEVQAVLE